jgi:preprotein translocase subunit YajC
MITEMNHQTVLIFSIIITVLIILIDYFFSYLNTYKREQEVKNQLKQINKHVE